MKLCRFFISFSICFFAISCQDKNHGQFVEKSEFNHIDFERIDSTEIFFRDYSYYKSKISSSSGRFDLFIIDRNSNGRFNDSIDIIHIDAHLTGEPSQVDFSEDSNIDNENHFSINGKPFTVKIENNNNDYFYDINWLSEDDMDQVQMKNRMIDKLLDLDFSATKNSCKENFKNYLHKGKYIYVDFWATWCSPCIQQIPEIVELYSSYSDELEILSIHSERSADINKINEMINENGMVWINGISTNEISAHFNFGVIPMGYLFSENGELLIYNATPQMIDKYLGEKLLE